MKLSLVFHHSEFEKIKKTQRVRKVKKMVRRSKRLSSLNQTGEEPQPVRTEETRTDAEVENWVSF